MCTCIHLFQDKVLKLVFLYIYMFCQTVWFPVRTASILTVTEKRKVLSSLLKVTSSIPSSGCFSIPTLPTIQPAHRCRPSRSQARHGVGGGGRIICLSFLCLLLQPWAAAPRLPPPPPPAVAAAVHPYLFSLSLSLSPGGPICSPLFVLIYRWLLPGETQEAWGWH